MERRKKVFAKLQKDSKKFFLKDSRHFLIAFTFDGSKANFSNFLITNFSFFFKKTRKTQIIAEIFFQDFFV